mgnify:CR=1 FL=1
MESMRIGVCINHVSAKVDPEHSDESCLTKTEGIYVAGDCRQKSIRQITTASADGAVAALAACRYIDNR